jgi:hypothetical protein
VHRAGWVLLISGLLGFRIGAVCFPDWQVAVETSQVVAGLVKYPAGNPFFIYHTKLWTVIHQICAPLLLAGVTEISLSRALSGVLGMLTFQALSMFVYALSEDVLLAIGAAVLIFVTRAGEYGAVYALYLLGNENTYGIMGLSFAVLSVALLGSDAYFAGAFLLGLAPAVHPVLGAWTCAVAACALPWRSKESLHAFRPAAKWFLIGAAATTMSLIVQLVFIYRPPPMAVDFSSGEIAAFITYWDGHRRPVEIGNAGVLLNVAALALATVWLLAFPEDLPRRSLFILRVAVVGALASIGLIFVSWIPPEKLPAALLILMPGRVLNYNALTFVALVIALAGRYRRQVWGQTLLAFTAVGLLVGDHSMLWEWLQRVLGIAYQSRVRPLWIVAASVVALVAGAGWEKWRRLDRPVQTASAAPRSTATPAKVARVATLAACALATVVALTSSQATSLTFRDRTNDVFLAQVASGRGLLLTAGDLHLIQLRTRRPVLLDGGGLDGLLYSLEAGPEMERILREVYGVDLLDPPEEARGSGRIPPIATQRVWESYSPEKWRDIARAFHVTQVLTYPDWTLNLPIAAHSRRLLLYDIPAK